MARTKINVPVQIDVKNDVSFNGKKITHIATPQDLTDAANKAYVDSQINSGVLGIGIAEDGSYADGLFSDFAPTTTVGTAVDRFNEVLKSLAPQPAPNLTSISFANSGVSGRLSFGQSHAISGYTNVPGLDINGIYSAGGTRKGIFTTGVSMSGTIADNVAASTNNKPYPAYAVGDGNSGTLHLEVNGTVIHSVDLTTFVSGSSLTSGSGFSLSAATSVQFANGDSFDVFKYRTGTWTVAAAAQRDGYNTVRVRHEYKSGSFRDTQLFDWVVDASTAATSYSNTVLDTLAATGSKQISGIYYNMGGTAHYDVTATNTYKNTASVSSSAISFTGTNCSAGSISLPTTTSENDNVTLTDVVVTITPGKRLLNGSISISTNVDRTINSNEASSSTLSISGLLIDDITESSSQSTENFNGEGYRIHSGVDISNISYGSGGAGASTFTWDKTQSLKTGTANYTTGLLISNDKLTYPKNTSHIPGITNGDFSAPANKPANDTSAQADYSTVTGNRTYLRYFYTSTAKSNFKLNVSAVNTNFVTVASGPAGNNLTLQVCAPNTTKDTGGVVAWKDMVVAHDGNDLDVGCYAGTYGNSIPTNWGGTLGAKNTSTSGGVILVKITASESWTGSIDSISLTWL